MAKAKVTMPEITIEEPGFIYIFVYNRSDSPNWVFFDEMVVTHEHSTVVAGADYYPFGLAMDGREITGEPYRWGYQGQYAQENDSTGWNEFQLRMYDARFGRWLSPDPYGQFASPYVGMGNRAHMTTDPTGGFTGGSTLLNEVIVTASRLPSIGGMISGLVGSVGRSLTTVGFANGACPKCPDPEWAELKKGASITFEDGTEYILDDPSLGRDGWIRNGGTMQEIVVTPTVIQKGLNWISKKTSNFASSFLRVGSSATMPVIQNAYMVYKEGVHSGMPKPENEISWADTYYLDNWQVKSSDIDVSLGRNEGLELMKSTSDVLMTVIPFKPTLQIGARTIPPKLIDFGTKQVIKKTRDAVLAPLYVK